MGMHFPPGDWKDSTGLEWAEIFQYGSLQFAPAFFRGQSELQRIRLADFRDRALLTCI